MGARLKSFQTFTRWHECLAKVDSKANSNMVQNSVVSGINVDVEPSPLNTDSVQSSFITEKGHRLPFSSVFNDNCENTMDLVPSNICKPMEVMSSGGSVYFIFFLENRSK